MEHKKNVFIECWKEKLYIHAFTHDLSKFLPSEFVPYARWFYGENGIKCKEDSLYKDENEMDFKNAWKHHYKSNKHHPGHWTGRTMPMKYVKQMVCDLKAMSRKFGGTAQEYYLKNYSKWDMTKDTRFRLERLLDLISNYNAPICECNWEFYATIGELIQDSEDYFNENGKIAGGTVENNINDLLKPACDKYNLNIYQLVKSSMDKR